MAGRRLEYVDMLIAIVDGERQPPRRGMRGACPFCRREVLAKCGQKKIWHWAHMHLSECDPWWENETDWHRAWKSFFPIEWQEVEHRNLSTGERHVADVKTPRGMVMEFQNSPMALEEMMSRESFYERMIWVVNGAMFISSFHILHALPHPRSSLAKDIVFYKCRKGATSLQHGLFWRQSEKHADCSLVEVHSTREIESDIIENYSGHHQFMWTNPRSVWFSATKAVFFDFGGPDLWRLQRYDDQGLFCVKRTSKARLIARSGGISPWPQECSC